MVRQHEWRVRLFGVSVGFVLVVVALLLLVHPTQAARYDVAIDNDLLSFSDGTLQRAALTSFYSPQVTTDVTGGVQLARSGELKPWLVSTGQLINPRTDSGVAVLGARIFIIGGAVAEQGNVNDITWTAIDQEFGAPINPEGIITGSAVLVHPNPLPEARGNDYNRGSYNCTTPTAARKNLAATGVMTGGTAFKAEGFIYVMGGSIVCGADRNVSSYSVLIGKVDGPTGRIAWRNGPPIPGTLVNTTLFTDGLELASAINLTTEAGKTYVYLIGGLKTYLSGSSAAPQTVEEGSRLIYYAEVDKATGNLKKSDGTLGWNTSTTDELIPISNPAAKDGLWNATAIPVRATDSAGRTREGFYLMSGQRGVANVYNPQLLLAEVVSTTGSFTWDTTPGVGDPGPGASLPEVRIGMGGAFYNSKLYLVGGREPTLGTIRSTVMTAVISDDLRLQLDSNDQVSFIGVNTPVLPNTRFDAAVAIVPSIVEECVGGAACSGEGVYAPAFIYAIGGEGAAGATDAFYVGRVGGSDETNATTVVNDGWYYSKPISVQYDRGDVNVKELKWFTNLDSSNDIAFEYRVSVTASGLCDAPDTFHSEPWLPLDGSPSTGKFSVNGVNSAALDPPPSATCLQYRAHLTTSNTNESPVLLSVQVITDVPGAPDIKLDAAQSEVIHTQSSVSGIKIVLKNENLFEIPTRPADFAERLLGSSGGSFYVDLCISPPGGTLVAEDFVVTNGIPACSIAYANVSKLSLGVDATYTIPSTVWKKSTTGITITNFGEFFTEYDETYKVYVYIDAANFVNEGTKGGETNNLNLVTPLEVTLNRGDNLVFFPIVQRPASANVAVQAQPTTSTYRPLQYIVVADASGSMVMNVAGQGKEIP